MAASTGFTCSPTQAWLAADGQQGLVGWDELSARSKRDTIPVWRAHDGSFSAQRWKSDVFVANDKGYAARASDCNVELHKNMALRHPLRPPNNGNLLQCGEIGGVGADTQGEPKIQPDRVVNDLRRKRYPE